MVGGPFTVKVKLVVAVKPPPSLTVSVMVATPLFPLTGVTVTVRDAPEPLKMILAVGTKATLFELPAIVSVVNGVKSSPTVNANADVAVLWLMS